MLSAKRFAILSGIFVALAGLMLGACGTGNNIVPQVQYPGGVAGQCAYGASYYPGAYGGGYYGNPYNQAAGCSAGYVFSGGQCICTTNTYNYGGCPIGYIMYGGRCVYSSGTYGGGYGNCPPGMYYSQYHGCRY